MNLVYVLLKLIGETYLVKLHVLVILISDINLLCKIR